jgi:RNA polymerase sigma-70 factor, ECF subfamily
MEQSDKALVRACCQGDRNAYATLIARHSKRVLAICYGIVGNADDAEDLTQEVLIKGYRKIASLRDGSSYLAWIAQIARHACMDFLRHGARKEIATAEPPDRPDSRSKIDSDRIDLRDAIGRLAEKYRVPLLFYYFDGRDTRCIAEALGISDATVHTRLSRARKTLRRLLTDEEVTR